MSPSDHQTMSQTLFSPIETNREKQEIQRQMRSQGGQEDQPKPSLK